MDCLINVKGSIDIRIDAHLLKQPSAASLEIEEEVKVKEEEPVQEEEKKDEPVPDPVIEEKKIELPPIVAIRRVKLLSPKASPQRKIV